MVTLFFSVTQRVSELKTPRGWDAREWRKLCLEI
nr:MAG TPA: Fanconi anaemia group A protein [Caudoviricetes sp.]